ncbi:2-C-methyl-D-erythritol 4-phosphate cytidylyltransferase [Natranaerobius trueperi]|uniref:2-C-methyl-D-erythritol 4-phosphate cytidylyltransferase n=1 Tax=Natranaerobius trueperi TaxID=759412 RepID=A0A226C2C2_9FIRM|nr:2-C-methyl-D-erythritol 4-phosphate cytidylyltransferase [Natranaerobius trueperi]
MISVVLPAGGQGKRMKSSQNKQYLMLNEEPILSHTWRVFARLTCVFIKEIILVVADGEQQFCEDEVVKPYISEKHPEVKVISGGKERQHSVFEGLKLVSEEVEMVVIHDGARPLVSEDVIYQTIGVASESKSAISAVPVKDTIKMINKNSNTVEKTLSRDQLVYVQTPQVFDKELIIKAYENAFKKRMIGTDDSYLVEMLGHNVDVVQGDYQNIKITTPEDLIVAKEILKERGS